MKEPIYRNESMMSHCDMSAKETHRKHKKSHIVCKSSTVRVLQNKCNFIKPAKASYKYRDE